MYWRIAIVWMLLGCGASYRHSFHPKSSEFRHLVAPKPAPSVNGKVIPVRLRPEEATPREAEEIGYLRGSSSTLTRRELEEKLALEALQVGAFYYRSRCRRGVQGRVVPNRSAQQCAGYPNAFHCQGLQEPADVPTEPRSHCTLVLYRKR